MPGSLMAYPWQLTCDGQQSQEARQSVRLPGMLSTACVCLDCCGLLCVFMPCIECSRVWRDDVRISAGSRRQREPDTVVLDLAHITPWSFCHHLSSRRVWMPLLHTTACIKATVAPPLT